MSGFRSFLQAQRRRLPVAGVLACAFLLKPVQDRIEARLDRASADPDILYFASPSVVKALALGYDGLVADVYWMRAIQYYGRREEAARRLIRYKNLPALLDIVTTLDPRMADVYRAGSVFLGEPEPLGAGEPLEAIRLLDKGIARLPGDWRLGFDKGFAYYLYLKDRGRAGQAWLDASRVPGAPPWMEGLAARALSEGGEVEMARSLWQRQLEEATRQDIRENARNHLHSIQADEDIWTLEFFVEKYAALYGARPRRLDDLVSAGLIRFVPADPSGVPYDYDPDSGWFSLNPKTGVRYIKMTYDYREEFRERLRRLYDAVKTQTTKTSKR